MKEVLKEILAAEKHAEDLLAEARSQAQARRHDIEKEFSDKIAAAKHEAQRIFAHSVEKARVESAHARSELISAAFQKDKVAIENSSGRIDALVTKIADLIIRTDTDRGR